MYLGTNHKMLIYFINLFCNIFFALFFYCIKWKEKNRAENLYLFLTAIQLTLLAGFRGLSVGYDTSNYLNYFNNAPVSFAGLIQNKGNLELGFILLCSIIKLLGGKFQILLLVTSCFVSSSICIFVKRHSRNIPLSIYLLICFPYYYTSFDLLRHYIVLSFVLIAYKYLLENELIKYTLIIFCASLFHKVAFVFLFLYFIKYIPWNSFTIIFILLLSPFGYLLRPFALWFGNLVGKGFDSSSMWLGGYSGGIRTALMYVFLFILSCLLYLKKKGRERKDDEACIYIELLLLTSILFIHARLMIRFLVSMLPFMAIGFPQLLSRQKKDFEYYTLLGCIVLIAFLYHGFLVFTGWQKITPYIPFWTL